MTTSHHSQPMSKKRVTLVHNQYNSPLGLYSTEEVAETLRRHTRLLGNGAIGVDFSLLSVPNLAKSEVYKMLSHDEPQLRYLHQQPASRATQEFSDRKRVAWPPSMNTIETIETIETRKYGYSSGIADMASHRDAYVSQKQGDYNAIPYQQQEDYNIIPIQTSGESNTISQQKQHNQSQSDNLLIQQSPKAVPPPPPPRAPRKPILRSYSDAPDPFTTSNESAFEQYSDPICPSVAAQQKQEPSKETKPVRMSSRRMPEPFASDELVGERRLIAKPSPPPGLLLRPAAVKKSNGFMRETPTIRSESFFKRGTTPVRMLGDMVWPPKGLVSTTDKQQLPTQSPGTARRQQKNYQGFFMQNQLPPNFPTYRAPPGTQHFGLEEGENATPM